MNDYWPRLKKAFAENRRSLLWCFVTYIPACSIAAYGGFWLFGNYVLGFLTAGCYALWVAVIAIQTKQSSEETD
jgi:hypothetical protein